jgi:two-component system response regulator DctR
MSAAHASHLRSHAKPSKWVAIVDDDGSVRTALARVLRIERIRVSTFSAAHEYLAASALDGSPSCLILDVHLGPSGMGGLELHDYLVAHGATLPVILMTAHDEVSSAEMSRRVGPDNYLRKPFDSGALVTLVQRALAAGAPAKGEPEEASPREQPISTR